MRKALTFARPLRSSFPSLALAAAALISASPAIVWAQDAPAPPEKPKAPATDSTVTEKPAEETPQPEAVPLAEAADPEPEAAETAPAAEGTAPEAEAAVEAEAEAEAAEGPDQPDVASPDPALPAPSGGEGLNAARSQDSAAVGFGAYPNPAEDQKALEAQGEERPSEVQEDRVFAEDWWSHTRPTIDLHGNFRVRTNLYHNFSLNRIDPPTEAYWPRAIDDSYTDLNENQWDTNACTEKQSTGSGSTDPGDANYPCNSPTQAGANIRFRLEPTIIISDNLRVHSQIDLLSNLVMGSTPQGYQNYPATLGGYGVAEPSGYQAVGGVVNSQDSPVSGINSLQDAISVRRAWAEYETPYGQLKFGRMADHWGLGIMHNAGDNLDGDYQSNVDRIAFTTGLPSLSLYAAGSWDFINEGATSAAFTPAGGQPYDLGQRDDVSRINLQLFRRMDPQLQALALAKGDLVVNGGIYLSYRWQRLANDYSGAGATCAAGADALNCQPGQAQEGIVPRGMKIWTPDLYGEALFRKFRAAVEIVTHQGKFNSLGTAPGDNDYTYDDNNGEDEGWKVRQWAIATELNLKLMEDRLLLGFYSGWATGDGDVDTLTPGNGVQEQYGDKTISTFRFHPGYRVDLILNRNLLSRVQGSYYFKPMAQYDFIRKASGLKVGGRAEAIWTRASNFMQTPGHHRDLGIELDATIYYQSKDGVLNTREDLTGGFYSMAQYGVLFPLSGLGYLQDQQPTDGDDLKLKPAQMVRVFLGVAF